MPEKEKKKLGKGCLIAIVVLAFLLIIIIAAAVSGGGTSTSSSAANTASEFANSTAATVTQSSTTSSVAGSSATATKSVDQTLTDGYYTAGIDIPTGTYNFKAISGSGNVITSDGTVNEIMGDGESATFNNAKLKSGVVLYISGVKLEITSSDASGAELKTRSTSGMSEKQLSAGNYTAGTDFDTGTYDIEAVSGSGNVICSNGLLGLNAIMGTDDSDGLSTKTYQNVTFSKGDVLQITGVTVKLTPSN